MSKLGSLAVVGLAVVMMACSSSVSHDAQAQVTAEPAEQSDAFKLAVAATSDDGMTAARLLEQVGPCKWQAVIFEASQKLLAVPAPFVAKLSVHSTLSGAEETITVSKVSWMDNNQRIQALATVTAVRCEKQR